VPAEGDGAGAGGGQLPLRAAAKRGPRRPHRPPPAANHPTSAREASTQAKATDQVGALCKGERDYQAQEEQA